jgi:hypothetical protein
MLRVARVRVHFTREGEVIMNGKRILCSVALLCSAIALGCNAEVAPTDRIQSEVLEHSFAASEATVARAGVVAWNVQRDLETDAFAVYGMGAAGEAVESIRIERTGEEIVLSAGVGHLLLSADGQVLEDSLLEREREILGLVAVDANGDRTPYSALACGASLGAVVASAGACGSGAFWACFAIPWAFCTASRECGNDVCH